MRKRRHNGVYNKLIGWASALALLLGGSLTTLLFTFTTQCTSFVFSPTTASFGYAANASNVTCYKSPVSTNGVYTGCAWAASANVSWITLTGNQKSDGTGSGQVPYSISSNFGVARSGTITFDSGQYGSTTYTITQDAPLQIGPAPQSLSATVGVAITPVQFTATGGSGSYTWSATGLPNNLSFSPSGVLSGVPATGTQGDYTPQFQVTDSNPKPGSIQSEGIGVPLTVRLSSFTITNPSVLSAGTVGSAYGPVPFNVSGGTGPYTWSAMGLPNGLNISPAGILNGTPAAGSSGSYNPQFTVKDSANNTTSVSFSLTINPVSAGPCSSLSSGSGQFTFGNGGGGGTVSFNSPCSWSATSSQPWVTLPLASGNSSSFGFTVSSNSPPGTARLAMININAGALTVAISQSGLVCTYTIADSTAGSGASRSFTAAGGGGGINVVAPAGCSWTATASQPFIGITGTSGNGNGGVSYTVAANTSPNAQSGTITIAGSVYLIDEQPAGSQVNACTVDSIAPPFIRPEGYSEKVADVFLTCAGKAPPGGLTGDILVGFSTGLTNLLLGSGPTDALLLEDEPTAANLVLGKNAFRGILSTLNGSAAILFPGMQLASASGGPFSHTWRITNVRVDAEALMPGGNVQTNISVTAQAPFIVSSQPVVAFIGQPSVFSQPSSTPGSGFTVQPVSFAEGFVTAFQPRLATGQDPSQAGTLYNSESGYVNSTVLGPQTGFATNGTRLIASIANVPAGVSVYAPVSAASGTNAELVSADSTGSGGSPVVGASQFLGANYQLICPIAPAVNCPTSVTATWEVTASNPNAIDTLTFNVVLVNPNSASLAGITYSGAVAPLSSGLAPQLPNTKLPIPRFASTSVQVPPPATVSLTVAPQEVMTQGQSISGSMSPSSRSAAATPASSVVGGTVTWTQLQANTGSASASTAPNVTVSGTLPPTWVIAGCTLVDSGGVCPTIDPNNPVNTYTITYPSLAPGQTGAIVLTAQSTSQTSDVVEYTASISSDLANTDTAGDTFTSNFPVAAIGLKITLTHASNFTQGQTGAQYTATVTNGGGLPITLPVTVTEIPPQGLELTSLAGPGWTCTLSTSSCTRSDPLTGNSAYPDITITVNVDSNAPGTLTNQAVAVNGVLQATGSDTTNIMQGTGAPPAFFAGETSLGSGVYYLQFPNGNVFGYFNVLSSSILYHYEMGFEAFIPGSGSDVYLYDFTSNHWWYTSATLFPYLYDFTLNSWIYYFADSKNPGHYTTNPRSFSNLTTGKIFTM